MNLNLKFAPGKADFFSTLSQRVNSYFKNNSIERTANSEMVVKTVFMFSLYFIPYFILIGSVVTNIWGMLGLCFVMGLGTAGIGLSVMHDANHGSYSSKSWVNNLLGISLNMVGGHAINWKVQHNVLHHTYTNVDGIDDDIDIQPWMRMSTHQKKYRLHKYQYIYFWGLYSLLYIFWIFVLDYGKYFKSKVGNMHLKPMKFSDHLIFWGFKLFHLFLFVGLPIYMVGFESWLVSFLIMTLFAGLVLSLVFQLAHTVEHTAFPVADIETNRLDDEWAIHQIKTTANFATHNKVISWLVGGLNFQIEHHLFPKISHVHYPAISKIIKKACAEYGIQYIEYRRMRYAVASHVAFLKQMGRG